jgi:hypothetical protein
VLAIASATALRGGCLETLARCVPISAYRLAGEVYGYWPKEDTVVHARKLVLRAAHEDGY